MCIRDSLSALAVASTARVAEGSIAPMRCEMREREAGVRASSVVTRLSWQSSPRAARMDVPWERGRSGTPEAPECDVIRVDSHESPSACMLVAGQNRSGFSGHVPGPGEATARGSSP